MRQIDRTLVNHPYNLLNLTAEQMAHLTNHKISVLLFMPMKMLNKL